jgi:hypothetical protein
VPFPLTQKEKIALSVLAALIVCGVLGLLIL